MADVIEDVIVESHDLTEAQIKETIKAYNTNASEYARMWAWNLSNREEVKSQIANHFSKWVESGSKVLIAGCGVGRDLEMLVDADYDCHAIDISEAVMEEAKSRGVIAKYQVMDIRKKLNFKARYFDAIYCESALEHVPKAEAKKVLTEFYRILKPNGIIYIGAKRGGGEVYYRHDVGSKKLRRFYVTYDDVEFHQLLASSGFIVVEFWIDPHFDRLTHEWLSIIGRRNS